MLGWAIKRSYQTATGASDAPRQPEDAGEFLTRRATVSLISCVWGSMLTATNGWQIPRSSMPPTHLHQSSLPAPYGMPSLAHQRLPQLQLQIRSHARRVCLQTTDPNLPQIAPETYWHPHDTRDRHLTTEASLVWSRDPAKTERCTRPFTYETPGTQKDEDMSEEDWEDEDGDNVTIDLNEPKSNSGKYWKSQFNKYHADAREEMSKLVKHKHLSRMYAQQKDIENTELQERVKELERQVQLKDEEIKQAQKRPALTRTTSVASASSRERQDSENWVAERARQLAEREVARLEREVAMLKKENADLRRENEIIKASAPDSAPSQAQVYRTTSAMTSERAAAAKARVAQKRRERAALRAN
ncbi:hypothetical protein PG993_009370 [Apiospora rasikravindrae]|uniref:Spindle pole body-associated protein cut12 domain-containing protein n=1 Tax=Apiospora rasikravindrae TaxID=990691 RepID=A0ABR1SJ71_9PEZI